ncbi:MAG: tetratricopeptide repeat protein [Bacteroidetes bacterium]|nr:MAG: tetratricopeptide repeat protein [Bacteroidota bacterium]
MLICINQIKTLSLRVTRYALRVTILVFIILLSACGMASLAQKERKLIREGNAFYEKGKYKEAEMNYRKALDADKNSTRGLFNLGDAVYQQRNFEESSKIFGNLAGSKLPSTDKANVFHNLGNSLLEAKDYEKSILAYQNSLLNNPSDMDTKYNLEYAKLMMKKQQQQQKQQQQKKDQQKQDKKDQKKNEQNKDQKSDKKDQQDQSKKISKEDADRMLEAMKKDEKKTLQKLKKNTAKVQQVLIEKDW